MLDGIDRWENEGGRCRGAPPRKETLMSSLDLAPLDPYPVHREAPIQRLLFVADAAVADVDELPPPVRAVIDAAAAVHVLTPTLPGRLAWLADEVDRCRHVADERLDTVLGHLDTIGVDADGAAARGSVLPVIADAVLEFKPDHILLALRSPQHANWQERGLVKRIEQRLGLPVTTYAVDPQGHASSADGPLLLCFDGSADARRAIVRAGALFAGRRALVMTVWQPIADLDSFAWSGVIATEANAVDLNRTAAERGARIADEGVRLALNAGLKAEPIVAEANGPVWRTIVEIAARHDAAAIVMGSRGLTGVRSMLLGSVSRAVLHHADRPSLVIRQPAADAEHLETA